MTTIDLQSLLKDINKPSQYLGNEVNAIHKNFADCKVRVALVFPDAYEMGMSHMGLKILYEILNNIEGVVAERCFAPGLDLEKKLREQNIPLFSLESKTPLNEFDIIGFSLPYELTYTNVINIIDLGQIPVFAKDRKGHHPLILAGGTCSYNPEPMADFLDFVAIGDGEEVILEIISDVLQWKQDFSIDRISQNQNTNSKDQLLQNLRKREGVYIPKFFEPEYNENQTLKAIKPVFEDYKGVKKRVVQDLNAQPYPTNLIIPNVKLIHDRIGIEIQRGCTRMCRFCQAGYIERPTRQRSPERVLEIADKSYNATGIDEISLLSLSAGDYATIVPTLKELNKRYSDKSVSISVPATRTETLTPEMIEQIKKVRMSGFTIAPEAGTERMRRVINKGNKVEDLMQACRNAFSAGYKLIKFYYMCGLPFEEDFDVQNIANEAFQALQIGKEYSRNVEINVSVSSFVPKPFTPFQWEPQMDIAETKRKHNLVRYNLKDKKLRFKHHDPEMSFLEGLFARGDRRLSQVIYAAFRNGCRFDEWSEHFDFGKWQEAFEETHLDLDFYLHRRREKDEVLPWDHLFVQMEKDWLWKEYQSAAKEAYIADCSVDKCASFCGVCDFKTVKNKIYVIDEKPLAAKKGNREWYGRFGQNLPETPSVPEPQLTSPATGHKPVDPRQLKLRAQFTKTGLGSLMGHLELMTALKRAVLRTGYSVAYTQGFHPQMKLALGYALPLGVESSCEYFDLVVLQDIDITEFIQKMNQALPQGLEVLSVEKVDLHAPSIYSITERVNYQVTFPESTSTQDWHKLADNITELQQGKELTFVRAPKKDKPAKQFVINEHVNLASEPILNKNFYFSTICHESGSLSPTEVVLALTNGTFNQLNQLRVKKIGISLRDH